MTYVLDSSAVIAFINREAGGDIVKRLIAEAGQGDCSLSISIVQLLEIFYDHVYCYGIDEAKKITEAIIAGPVSIIEHISYPIMYDAGRLKTTYHCSLADAIACATAISLQAVLVTADHNELEAVEKGENLSVLWLPAHPKK
ncbi:hypothetical protein AGMMS49546_13880 [Spirochaetia bacterium]|nr:hypothetical protein AGMMS49546_13880 [Spirochaetia bacterium]